MIWWINHETQFTIAHSRWGTVTSSVVKGYLIAVKHESPNEVVVSGQDLIDGCIWVDMNEGVLE